MRTAIPCLLAALLAAPLAAQGRGPGCLPAESVNACQQRLTPTGTASPKAEQASAALTDAAARLEAKAPGPDLSSAGPLSAISDFLPRLATALLAPATGGGGPELGFKTNLSLNDGALFRLGLTGQVSAVFHDPKLYGPLVDSIPEEMRETARTSLQGGLSLYDNVAVTGALNVESRVFGRSMRPHVGTLDILAQALAPSGVNPVNHERQLFLRSVIALHTRANNGEAILDPNATNPTCKNPPESFVDLPMECFASDVRDSLDAGIRRLVDLSARHIAAGVARIRASGFSRIAQLVNNQPQFNVSWELDPRATLVGPTEWTGRARFEMGFANMNGLRRYCKGTIAPACLERYLANAGVAGSLSRADRVFAQLDVTRRNSWSAELPAQSVSLSLPSSTSLSFSGGYGAYISNAADNENRDRIDLQTKFDWARDDVVRQNRWVSTLFYTRHVTGQATALIGFTWANRPEFVGDVTRHLGANIGFTYKLNQDPASAAGQK
jgi:hypothetical protein